MALATATGEASLRVDGVHFAIGAFQILKGVTLACERGRITSLLGPNGAGKTTLLNCISGLYQPTSGEIRAGGTDLRRLSCHQVARAGVARTFQTPQVVDDLTVVENVMLGGQARLKQRLLRDALSLFWRGDAEHLLRIESIAQLERVGLAQLADHPAAVCNHIQRRLVEVARALCARPHTLLLDEPCAGMGADETGILEGIMATLAADGMTILLVEHNVAFVARVSDHVAVLDQGHVIAEGAPDEVLTRQEVIDAYLGR